MRILWVCGVPAELQTEGLGGRDVGSYAAWSWVMGHLPPPREIELHIACPAKNIGEEMAVEYKGATFHLFPYRRGAIYTFYKSWAAGLRKIVDRIQPDWVHGWGTEAGFSSTVLNVSPLRSIVEIQGILSDYAPYLQKSLTLRLGIFNERLTLRKASRLLAESEYSASETRKYTQGTVRVIAHPLRRDFLQLAVGSRLKKQIVFLGTLNSRKGIKDAIQAFAAGAPPEWRMLCIGGGTPGYTQEVQELIGQLQVAERVDFINGLSSDEIIQIFQESPAFLLPTYMDTGPTALKEALAMGLWPVCYDNSGPRELIGRYGYGSLVETGNTDKLGRVLKEVLENQPWQDAGVTEKCVEKVRHDLSPDTVWKQLIESYSDEFWRDGIESDR